MHAQTTVRAYFKNNMTCKNPKIAVSEWVNKLNEKTGEIYRTKRLHFLNWTEINEETPHQERATIIPCGKCEGCLIDKANDWATRCYLEAKNWPVNCFITLTYNTEHLPKKRSLAKTDLQKFWKKLRHHADIRYMACGEYGPKTARPHYHAAVFNYFPDDAKPYKQNIVGDWLYTSQKLNKIWGKGYVIIGNLSYESAAYIARYVYKKAYGADEWPVKKGQEKEFRLSSRRPGIAATTIGTEEWARIKRNFGIFIKTKEGVKLKKIPEFLKIKWRELDNREEYYQKSDSRAAALKAEQKNIDTSLNWWQKNKQKNEVQAEKLKKLDKRENIT